MADLQLLLEAEKRGLLPADKQSLLTEARTRGLVPKLEAAPATEGMPAERSFGGFMRNVGGDIVTTASNLAQAVAHPLNTAKGVLDIGAGALQNVLPKQVVSFVNKSETPEALAAGAQAVNVANALGAQYAKDYGSVESVLNKAYNEPVQMLGDVSTILSGGAGLAGKAGLVKTAGGLTKAANLTNSFTPVSKLTGKLYDAYGKPIVEKVFPSAEKSAANIVKEAAGDNLAEIRAVLNEDKIGTPLTELLAGVDRNQISALAALARQKDKSNFYAKLDAIRAQDSKNALNNLAGGATNTEILNNLSKSKEALNQITTPIRETELAAANTGKYKQRLEQQAATLGEIASNKVDDVRRFVAARDRLGGGVSAPGSIRKAAETGMPTPNKYTLEGEMSDAAERVATKAAEDSRLYGEGARFAQARADSLAAHNLKPLDTDKLVGDIATKLNNPKIGVSDVNRKVLTAVANKVKEWTDRNGGVIDVNALYEIRKSTVNETIEKLTAGQNPSITSKRAAQLLNEIKPLIDDAIIKAGGSNWKNYLDTFSAGMDVLNQRKLAQVARDMPADAFIKLVRGESPAIVEDIFGYGQKDIKAVMGSKYKVLDDIATQMENKGLHETRAAKGMAHLKDIVTDNQTKLRIRGLGVKSFLANEVLAELGDKINNKTLNILEKGFKSGKNFEDMLNEVPFGERGRIYNAYDKINRANVMGAATISNTLAPENRNNLGR